jgi:hypothetical protein
MKKEIRFHFLASSFFFVNFKTVKSVPNFEKYGNSKIKYVYKLPKAPHVTEQVFVSPSALSFEPTDNYSCRLSFDKFENRTFE